MADAPLPESELVAAIPRLRRYARVLTGDATRADDVVQETLARSWEKRRLWAAGSDLRAWMFTIMHNLFVNQRALAARDARNVSIDDEGEGGAPMQLSVAASQQIRVELLEILRELARLPVDQREVLVLAAVEEMRYEDIARMLAIPVGTVMSRLSRAREKLRRSMSDADEVLDGPRQRLLDAAKRPATSRLRRTAQHLGLPSRFALAWAVAATLVIGVALGWYGRDVVLARAGMPTTFAQQMAYAHVLYASDPNRPVEMWAPDEKRLVAWLSKRLDYPLHAPDLESVGYALVGGRLVAGNERPTAMFVYENAAKQRLTLQARKSAGAGETAFRYAVADGVGVFYWIDDNCAYALTGELDRARLLAVGELVYKQLAEAGDRH